jgi:peptidoglycan hydrolase-like amidase
MPNRFIIIFILVIISLLVNVGFFSIVVFAEDIDQQVGELDWQKENLQKEADTLSDKINDLKNEINGLETDIGSLSNNLSDNQAQLEKINNEIVNIENSIEEIKKELDDKKTILDKEVTRKHLTIRGLYKTSRINPFYKLLENSSLDTVAQGIRYQIKVVDQAKEFITNLNNEIKKNTDQKNELEEFVNNLSSQKSQLAAIVTKLALEKKTTEEKISELSTEQEGINRDLSNISQAISELTNKQQELLGQKSGNFYASLSDGLAVDDPKSSPDYNPGFSPAFAAFSYGAFTHRNGMSQYGAKARAEDGQSVDEILEFYYRTGIDTKDDFPEEVSVEGYGNMDYQRYLYGLGEMPDSWPMEALKAQAIAARTYAYKRGGTICITQSCQVFIKSKSDNPPSRWQEAVDNTKNMILNNPSTAQYSSTTGGYINNVGWDGDWPNNSYEKKAGSPWFYKAWYTESTNINSAKCGMDNPWLNEEEMVDILNAWVVWKNGGDSNRISPVTTDCWGGDPYSHEEMAEKADNLGDKFTNVNSVSVGYNDGYTNSITFNTNNGSITIDGQVFKTIFNLRAPGYIAIKTPLYNLVRK